MGIHEQMHPNVLTAWRKVPEGRKAAWENLGQMRCRWECRRGAHRSNSGDTSTDSVLVILPSHSVAPPLAIQDRVALGTTEATEPPADALSVTSFTSYWLAVEDHPNHWEVEAR